MADEQKSESEREDLLDRIDVLKKQIKTFENELGIDIEELRKPMSGEESHVLHKMLESEQQLGVIEKLMKKDAQPPAAKPTEIKVAKPSPAPVIKLEEEKLLEAPHVAMLAHTEKPKSLQPVSMPEAAVEKQHEAPDMERTAEKQHETLNVERAAVQEGITSDLKEKSRQIAEISAMVSQLRENMQAIKQRQPEEKPMERAEIAQPKSVISRGTEISKEDLPLISNLIEKLDSLIRSNQEISDRLREMISENKNVNAANKVSDLIKKLAQAGLNG